MASDWKDTRGSARAVPFDAAHRAKYKAARRAPKGQPHAWIAAHQNYEGKDCLVWPFCTTHGYAVLRVNGKNVRVSRLMCTLKHGEPVGAQQAAHSCGNRACVNPAHLRWATQSENERDKLGHGRHCRGERFYKAKLSDFDVLAIRGSKQLPGAWLAKKYGVSRNWIYIIQRGEQREWM